MGENKLEKQSRQVALFNTIDHFVLAFPSSTGSVKDHWSRLLQVYEVAQVILRRPGNKVKQCDLHKN